MKAFRDFLFTTALCCAAPAMAQQTGVITELTGPATVRTPYSMPYGANLNTPVASGYVVTTGPGTHAEIRFAGAALRLSGGSEIELVAVDPRALVINLMYGSLGARLRAPETAQAFELRAPQGRALALDAGSYRFDLPRGGDSLGISVWQGAVRFEGPSSSLNLLAGSRIELRTGAGLSYNLAELRRDAFDEWTFALDRRDETTFAERYEGSVAASPVIVYSAPSAYAPPAMVYAPPVAYTPPPVYVYRSSPPVFVHAPFVQRPHVHFPRAHSHPGFSPSHPHALGRTFDPGSAANVVRPVVPAAVPGARPVLPAAGAIAQPTFPDGRFRGKGHERFTRSVR